MTTETEPAPSFPLSFSELARRVGRNPSAVTRAMAGPLRDAVLPGRRIDALHPATVAWAAKRGATVADLTASVALRPAQRAAEDLRVRAPMPVAEPASPSTAAAVRAEQPVRGVAAHPEPDALLGMTLAEITERYGSMPGFADYVDVRKRLAEVRKLEMANDVAEGSLISRELVRAHVFGLIDGISEAARRRSEDDREARLR